jgi:hypothetical protein
LIWCALIGLFRSRAALEAGCPSTPTQRAAAQIPEAIGVRQYGPPRVCGALSCGSWSIGRTENSQAADGDPLAPRRVPRFAWAHDWVSAPTLAAVFQTLLGASFIVNGAAPAKNSAFTSAGAELRLSKRRFALRQV